MLDLRKNGKKSLWFNFITHEYCTWLFSISSLNKIFKRVRNKGLKLIKEVRKCSWTLYFTIFFIRQNFRLPECRLPWFMLHLSVVYDLHIFSDRFRFLDLLSPVTPMCYFSQGLYPHDKTSACLVNTSRISVFLTVYCCFILIFPYNFFRNGECLGHSFAVSKTPKWREIHRNMWGRSSQIIKFKQLYNYHI